MQRSSRTFRSPGRSAAAETSLPPPGIFAAYLYPAIEKQEERLSTKMSVLGSTKLSKEEYRV